MMQLIIIVLILIVIIYVLYIFLPLGSFGFLVINRKTLQIKIEKSGKAVKSDLDSFRKTWMRPKWDIVQE